MKSAITVMFLMILAVGCASSNFSGDNPLAGEVVVFPHAESWSSPEDHGGYVNAHGLAACEACHGTDENGARFGKCAGCHTDYPHEGDWSSSGHKAVLNERGTTTDCATTCHGEDLHGGRFGHDCALCHTQYPHDEGWSQRHPEVALSATTSIPGRQFDISPSEGVLESCTDTCHNTETSIAPTCRTCHESGIHQEGWREIHGPEVTANGTDKCSTTCHGADLSGGLLAPACSSCHEYPHAKDGSWGLASGHGAGAGRPDAKCELCHDPAVDFNDTYGSEEPASSGTAPSCYACHRAYPHISYTYSAGTLAWNALGHGAHILMIMRNRRLFTAGGSSLNDPSLINSVRAQCANGPDGCHFGARVAPASGSGACRVCH